MEKIVFIICSSNIYSGNENKGEEPEYNIKGFR
jgi:hypothetical protein